MSIEDENIIDKIGIDKVNGDVVLVISDHIMWDDLDRHKLLLVKKINSYLYYIKSGNIFNKYPEYINKNIRIELVLKYFPPESGVKILNNLSNILREFDIPFKYYTI
ncbi:MAG: DUF6572 domain-containing protein [Pseudomonadota bacterium]|jgi:hypothetical protein